MELNSFCKGCMRLEKLVIEGMKRLEGEIKVQGSKNSSLPILAATLVTGKSCILHNCPILSDTNAAIKILRYLGCKAVRAGHTVITDSTDLARYDIPEFLMREMRSSIVFLGALLSRFKKAEMTSPGGCEIGLRPIDLHLSSLEALGVKTLESSGKIYCSAPNGLHGAKITLSFPSVGATENIMLAAVGAKGTTIVINAAREPEIADLADFLNGCGADIKGAGSGTLVIEGKQEFFDYEHTVIPDRIVASTLMTAAAVTGGNVLMKDVNTEHLMPVLPYYEKSGCVISSKKNTINIKAPRRLSSPGLIRTMPYPGFPTDSQAGIMAMASICDGTSVIIENIFESRYKHVPELIKMGARITVQNSVAVVEGVGMLHSAVTQAADLRGGVALVTAALAAEGETTVRNIHHIDRGCENLPEMFTSLGGKVTREKDTEKRSEDDRGIKGKEYEFKRQRTEKGRR